MKPRDFLKLIPSSFTSGEAAVFLGLSSNNTAKVLHRWCQQGWIQRLGRGLYTVVPLLGSETSSSDDPFSLVPSLVGEEGYICGWSALSHWGLTEQIFRDISVASCKNRGLKKRATSQGVCFLFPAQEMPDLGLKILWYEDRRVFISDMHRTVFECVAHPAWGAGLLHVIDGLKNYLIHEDCALEVLMSYAQRAKGVFFKRFGFLLERLGGPETVIKTCQERITKGYSLLSPSIGKWLFCRKWNLIVPENLKF